MWPEVPEEMSEEAYDLLNKLLSIEPSERLGARGAQEVKVMLDHSDPLNLCSGRVILTCRPIRSSRTSSGTLSCSSPPLSSRRSRTSRTSLISIPVRSDEHYARRHLPAAGQRYVATRRGLTSSPARRGSMDFPLKDRSSDPPEPEPPEMAKSLSKKHFMGFSYKSLPALEALNRLALRRPTMRLRTAKLFSSSFSFFFTCS
jgi:serine/threonine protein kinase